MAWFSSTLPSFWFWFVAWLIGTFAGAAVMALILVGLLIWGVFEVDAANTVLHPEGFLAVWIAAFFFGSFVSEVYAFATVLIAAVIAALLGKHQLTVTVAIGFAVPGVITWQMGGFPILRENLGSPLGLGLIGAIAAFAGVGLSMRIMGDGR